MLGKHLRKFFDILDNHVRESANIPIDMTLGFKCAVAEITMEYIFDQPFGFLDSKSFTAPLIVAFDEWLSTLPVEWYFPRLCKYVYKVTTNLSDAVLKEHLPLLAETRYMKAQVLGLVNQQLVSTKTGESSKSKETSIIRNIITKNMESADLKLSKSELTTDIFQLFAAGTDTTANVLMHATWFLINNTDVRLKLVDELKRAIPDVNDRHFKSQQELERLLYLSAVIKESLRFSHGIVHRQPRISQSTALMVDGHHIPAGSIVAFSTPAFHLSEKYFKDADRFVPERWLSPDAKELEHNLIAFPRGPRACIGQNLAWLEMYTVLAYMFRRFEITNSGMTHEDMEWMDYIAPATRKHLKVTLKVMKE